MSEKKTFIQCADVETQVFDWGRLNWLSEPLVTAAEHFSCGWWSWPRARATCATTIRIARRFST